MKKIFLIIIFSWIFWLNSVFAETKTYIDKSWYDLYKEIIQKEDFCAQYNKTDKNSEKIMILDESKYFLNLDKNKTKVWEDLKKARADFEKNMDSIFWCATYGAYYRSLKLIRDDLIKKNPKLNSKIKSKLEQKMNEIKQKASKLEWKCKLDAKKNNLVKKSVLEQTTYEFCKYNYYLEYLKDYNKKISNVIDTKWKKTVEIKDVNDAISEKIKQIDAEALRAYRAHPIALQAYNDFENNIWAHILLELLKEDYKVLRLWIHKTLNPINQVIYKISNAMRK